MTARRFALSPEEAQALADEIRADQAARKRAEDARTRLGLDYRYVGVLARWQWKVLDLTAGKVLASGRAWTEWGTLRRLERAYLRELDRLAEGRADS